MIPKESTPIKHTILIEIIAQGRLTYDEVRIASFIMRWSWGFDDKENNRRQDWTKEFTITEIAKEIKMKRSDCSRTINKMMNEEKLLKDSNKYQFNEHYENWKSVSKRYAYQNDTPPYQIDTPPVSKRYATVSNCYAPDVQETLIAKELEGKNENHKDTLKILDKDTLKIIAHENEKQEISLKDEKQEKAKELIKQFCSLRSIPLDSGFFAKNIRSARSLVGYYPVELILAGITWRLKNDPDNFWIQKLWSLNSVYSHFAEWIAQSKLKTEKTFTDWLARNTEQDYRAIEEPDAKVKAFFVSFNRALKDGICPTPEEWTKYQKARELNNESLRR